MSTTVAKTQLQRSYVMLQRSLYTKWHKR